MQSHPFMANRRGRSGSTDGFSFLGLQNHCAWWLQPQNSKIFAPWKESSDQSRQHIKSRDITLSTKVPIVKAMVFLVVVYGYELDHKAGWAPKNWCFRTVVLEKTLESPLDSKEIKPVNPKGNQPWIFIGRTDAKADTLATWCEELTHWKKRPWCWERLKAKEEGSRGWDGWMASLTLWTWV